MSEELKYVYYLFVNLIYDTGGSMSFFNKAKTPVHSIRSLFFLMAAVCCIVYFFPIISYANEASQIEEVSTEGSAEEAATEDSTEDTEVEEEQTVIFSQNIYHKHTGSSSGGGGCYTVKKTKKETVEPPWWSRD